MTAVTQREYNARSRTEWEGVLVCTLRELTNGFMKIPAGTVCKVDDKMGIPERLALALQADGWHWRSTVVWAKPNGIPESVSGWRWERHKIKVRPAKRGLRGDPCGGMVLRIHGHR